MSNTDRRRRRAKRRPPRTPRMPRWLTRYPIIGEVVHFYERRNGNVFGPFAAIVTVVEGPYSNAVNLAVVGEAALRFIPLVPYNDGGSEAGVWWTWVKPVDPEHVRQNGL